MCTERYVALFMTLQNVPTPDRDIGLMKPTSKDRLRDACGIIVVGQRTSLRRVTFRQRDRSIHKLLLQSKYAKPELAVRSQGPKGLTDARDLAIGIIHRKPVTRGQITTIRQLLIQHPPMRAHGAAEALWF